MLEENGIEKTEEIGAENKETNNIDTKLNPIIDREEVSVRKPQLWVKGQSGNPKGRPKSKPFSLREDLIQSLRRIKKQNPAEYKRIIDSYWKEGRMRQFLLEIVDGKARQSTEIIGSMENPVRIIEVKPMELPKEEGNEAK